MYAYSLQRLENRWYPLQLQMIGSGPVGAGPLLTQVLLNAEPPTNPKFTLL